jgi:hypothetical protein
MQPDFSQIGPFVLAAVVVLAVYRRLRRSFGRQALRPVRMTVRIALLAVVAATSMVKSPLTVGIFFVLVGYYGWYYSWLLWKSKHLNAADIDAAPVVTTP